MRKILSLALLISLGMGNIGTVIAAEKTPVLNAGAEEVKVDGTKPETKKKKETKSQRADVAGRRNLRRHDRDGDHGKGARISDPLRTQHIG